ncbi:MAG: DUF1905 domain-containing protein [Actinomycetia bacterium]|nr:DUF1905 domain-containing protein [Actinomycetes bacterium]MCP4227419.1 DUF1905 domain-containing protein [Actinomycetes bacterium]MCP5033836.1 DUF1905 domain-containing protein [Actinomycetes bacterium]
MTLSFEADLYRWKQDMSWVFVSLPIEVGEEIHDMPLPRRGFGSVKVQVRTGTSEWLTSVFPDKASGSFVLPIKKAVRIKEQIDVGDTAEFEIQIRLD